MRFFLTDIHNIGLALFSKLTTTTKSQQWGWTFIEGIRTVVVLLIGHHPDSWTGLSQAFNKNKHVLKINPKEKKRWCESPETTFALALNRPRKPVHHLNPSDSDPHFIKSPRDTDRKSLQEHRKLVELQEHVLAWWQSQKWSFGLLKFTLCGFLFSLLKRNEV